MNLGQIQVPQSLPQRFPAFHLNFKNKEERGKWSAKGAGTKPATDKSCTNPHIHLREQIA
jgi:hypothetical protein